MYELDKISMFDKGTMTQYLNNDSIYWNTCFVVWYVERSISLIDIALYKVLMNNSIVLIVIHYIPVINLVRNLVNVD